MRAQVEQRDIARIAKAAQNAIKSRNTIPMLECFLIKAEANTIYVTGTDMDMALTVRSEAVVTVEGKCAVNARDFSAWISAAPKGSVVEINVANLVMSIEAGSARGRFVCLPPEDFPVFAQNDDLKEVICEAHRMKELVPFASTEELRYYLQGVFIGRGGFWAADGHRMGHIPQKVGDVEMILPLAGVNALATMKNPRLFIGTHTWAAESEDSRLDCKSVDGVYPQLENILTRGERAFSCASEDLLNAISIASVCSLHNGLGVQHRGGRLVLGAGLDKNAQCDVAADIATEGGFGCNRKYLEQAVNFIGQTNCDVGRGTSGGAEAAICVTSPDTDVVANFMPERLNIEKLVA